MIAINDLRIGNYTKTFNRSKGKKILVITVKDLFQIESGTLEEFPIDLVDAWLPRFGFSHEENVFIISIYLLVMWFMKLLVGTS